MILDNGKSIRQLAWRGQWQRQIGSPTNLSGIMFLASINKTRQLLCLSYIGEVRAAELAKWHDEVVGLMADLNPGFSLLTDLSHLASVDLDCVPEIGRIMDLCDQKGVELIVRVIPDPTKDIGLGILSLFHYPHRPRRVTCETMVEAGRVLEF
jgi:anti-anti-sigma regulatory factor